MKPVYLKYYMFSVTLVHRFAGFGGVPELLAPNPEISWSHQLPIVVCQN
jgi:hypothetical protein